MAVEIERVFLVNNDSWRRLSYDGKMYSQAYLLTDLGKSVRVRIVEDKAFLTIKGKPEGISRAEFEYEIPLADAKQLMEMCDKSPVEKIRYKVKDGDLTWEVDEFLGENAGLIMAEVELPSEDAPFTCWSWLGKEVSYEAKYCNASLYQKPYSKW
ncbi:MAG: CYTH domain-containing protein [Bacteroidales bacterium]